MNFSGGKRDFNKEPHGRRLKFGFTTPKRVVCRSNRMNTSVIRDLVNCRYS